MNINAEFRERITHRLFLLSLFALFVVYSARAQETRIRLTPGKTYLSENVVPAGRFGLVAVPIRVELKTTPRTNKLTINFYGEVLKSCDEAQWRVLAETMNSPNVLIIDQSDLTVTPLKVDPKADPDLSLSCSLTLAQRYIWANAYFWIPAPGAPPKKSSDKSASDGQPPKQMWFEKKFPALSAPGAINAQFKYSPGFGSADQTSATVDIEPYWRLDAIKSWLGYSIVYDYDSRPQKNPDALLLFSTYAFRACRPTWTLKCTKSGEVVDPNHNPSSRMRVRPCALNGKPGGLEYAPQRGDLNFITAWACGIPFILDLLHQPSWLTLTPTIGIETGVKLETVGNPSSQGLIFRGVPGADASLRWLWTGLFGSKPLTLTAKYRARIPVNDETFTDAVNTPSGKPLPAPILTTRTRNYAEAQVSVPIFKTFSISLTYQYGSLPPAFVNFGQSIQLGIKAASPGDYEH
jgi:hypothetical protein